MDTEVTSNDGMTKVAELKALDHEAAVLELSEKHQRVYEDIRDLLDGQRHDKATTWYAVGQKVVKVMADAEYGKKAVAKIAKALGRDATGLYEAGRVARTWSRQQFERLIEKRDIVRGNRLSWSHLVELLRVDESRDRNLLINKVLDEGLSVRDLEREIDGPEPTDDREEGHVAKALRNFKAAQETMVVTAPRWNTSIFDVLHKQNDELGTPLMLGLLQDVRATQLQASQTCEDQLARLDRCITDAKELLSASEGQPAGEELQGRPQDLDETEATNG